MSVSDDDGYYEAMEDNDSYYEAVEEVALWRERYYKLRGMVQDVSACVHVQKATLMLNIAGAAQVKNKIRAQLVQDVTRELLQRGVFTLAEQDLDEHAITMSCSVLVVPDRKTLVNFIREVGDDVQMAPAQIAAKLDAAEGKHDDGEDEPR